MNEQPNGMADNAIKSQSRPSTNAKVPIEEIEGVFPSQGEPFESRYAIFSTAISQLKKAAVILDGFDLQVSLKWKKNPDKTTPGLGQVKFPEMPRYVTRDVATMVMREEFKQTSNFKIVQENKAYQRQHPEPPPESVNLCRESKSAEPTEPHLQPAPQFDMDLEMLEELRELAKYDKCPWSSAVFEKQPNSDAPDAT
jgi:hypothetical protein